MSWNNALERKKFERRWSQEEKAYREAGMTEEQILSIRELEEEQYRSNRRYQMKKLLRLSEKSLSLQSMVYLQSELPSD